MKLKTIQEYKGNRFSFHISFNLVERSCTARIFSSWKGDDLYMLGNKIYQTVHSLTVSLIFKHFVPSGLLNLVKNALIQNTRLNFDGIHSLQDMYSCEGLPLQWSTKEFTSKNLLSGFVCLCSEFAYAGIPTQGSPPEEDNYHFYTSPPHLAHCYAIFLCSLI